MKNTLKALSFNILSNTVMKDMPTKIKKQLKQSWLDSSNTETSLFLQTTRSNGYVLPNFITEEDLKSFCTFKTRPGDVFLGSYPKSGTTWLAEIVRCIVKPRSSGKENFVPLFEVADYEQLEALPSPRCISTHLPFALLPHNNENNVKYIYIARNPKDVAVSAYHFFEGIPIFGFKRSRCTWEEFLENFMKGEVPGGSYFDHSLGWWTHKDDDNVLFLKYEELKKDLQSQVKIIAEFLGFHFSDEEAEYVAERCTFQAMKSNSNLPIHKLTKFFKTSHLRKGIVGDWKNHFSDEQLEQFQKLYESRLNGTGLNFEFEV
ncbi:sulfotransferase domain-containing protein [Pleurocapsales cyanobacterium LEGE 06147]|nr:sulfotransferase domain-containing protein [Pleurocapsales cyanobacterium LEGE 06147]